MAFLKYLILIMVLLTGCSTTPSHKKDMYEQGFRQGVQEQVRQIAAQFQGGKFPYYHWVAPIVQEVRVPAHLNYGVMIPEHNELVIIKPGEWTMSEGYPIQTQESHNDNTISYMHMDVSNLTPLPKSVGEPTENVEQRGESQDYPAGMEQSEE